MSQSGMLEGIRRAKTANTNHTRIKSETPIYIFGLDSKSPETLTVKT